MSEIRQVGSEVQVRAAIARAADATGVDFDYLLAQAKIESSLNPQARAGTSSAAGLYQFVGSTWMDTLAKHGAQHGFGGLNDPAMKASAMALRFDPDASALMAAELASEDLDEADGILAIHADPAFRVLHEAFLPPFSPHVRGVVDPDRAVAEAKLNDADSAEEAARWLRPKERNVVLQDRALIGLLARLPRTAPVRVE